MNDEIQSQVAVWRAKAREGALTREEMKSALALLRNGRERAAAVSKTSRTASAAKKVVINSDDLLAGLEGM